MAATSTNKQPLLVDRVFCQTKDLTGKFIPPGVGIDLQAGSQGELILDCTKNDGAVVEYIASYSRRLTQESYPSEQDKTDDTNKAVLGYVVNLYLCPSTTYLDPGSAFFVGDFLAGVVEGELELLWAMPYTHSPVARLGSTNQEADTDAGEYGGLTPTMYQALYVPKGMCLWAAVNQQILSDDDGADDAARAPLLLVQGGYF